MSNDNPLIRGLQNPAVFDHEIAAFQVVETHISWVLLTGPYAYKIKKPVDLGFLDFSSLARRHHFCKEEIRLNSRLAPSIYLEVVAIYGTPSRPSLDPASGEIIEYAVKMRQFPQAAQLDRVLQRGELTAGHIGQLAETVAHFHQDISIADAASPFGTPERIMAPCLENFEQIEARITAPDDTRRLETLRHWTQEQYARLRGVMAARKAGGFIRECHGDLHLRNIALLDDTPQVFDCIEFNDDFRWIDVMSEAAFTVMDLEDRQRRDFAWAFLNHYLEITGDYAGLALLRFFLVYRAMVRAKVDCIRASQPGLEETERHEILQEYRSYITLAESYMQPRQPVLFIAHGLSGSGKTFYSQHILEQLPAVRIRSDIERKRLFGLEAGARTASGVQEGIYSRDASRHTYARLNDLAGVIINAGYSVIVDATFLKQAQREPFTVLADQLGVPYVILEFTAPQNMLRQRIVERARAQHDASEADLEVLEHQLHSVEPLTDKERTRTLTIDTREAFDAKDFQRQLQQLLAGKPVK
jgi:aminoglycoside phosphotransferase family enzyme/predicted kinase